ncbi:Glutamate-rich protein 6 [Lamellibrachia satsuma]|nr:Glutamate-rich protein 6 [Lamellibrachia satsuma]
MDVDNNTLVSRDNQTAEVGKQTPEPRASSRGPTEMKKIEPLPPIATSAQKDSTRGSIGRHPKILSRHRELDDEDQRFHSNDSDKSNSHKKTDRSPSVAQLESPQLDQGLVSVVCQTEWSWLEDMRISQRLRSTPSRSRRSQVTSAARASSRMSFSLSGHRTPKPTSGGSCRLDSRDTAFSSEHFTPQPLRNDEYGIPILGMNSDSDSSDGEEAATTGATQPPEDVAVLPSIGPPQILQYQAESKKKDLEITEKELTAEERLVKFTAEAGSGMKCEFCGNEIRPFPTLDDQKELSPDMIYCCEQYKELINAMMNHPAALKPKSESKISIAPHPPYGSKQARKVAKERAAQRLRERELARQQASFPTGQGAGGGLSSFYQFARQMRTINYMLSSQRCMDEGWTIRPPSPVLEEEPNCNIFEPVLPAEGEGKERSLVQKFYPDGSIFLIHFPDGTGTVFYPSGKPAITISMQNGVYTFIAQDEEEGDIMAVFQTTGQAMSYYANGNIRIFIDIIGGLELDIDGSRKRRWTWKEQVEHVHAPPIQPIMFAMTRHLAVRILSQEHITLTFSYGTRACRFQVGSKLKKSSWRWNEQDASGHRWLAAKCQRYEYVTKIECIDLSRPFDTIRQKKILDDLHSFIDTDNVRIIRLLLSETNITPCLPLSSRQSALDKGLVVAGPLHRVPRSRPTDTARMSSKPTTSRPQHTQ